MRYLSTVYVREHRAKISYRRGSLLVSSPEGKQRVPLEGIEGLVLLGGAQITTDALGAVRGKERPSGLTEAERSHPLRCRGTDRGQRSPPLRAVCSCQRSGSLDRALTRHRRREAAEQP